jgi:major membrane immunogen (membrane-anchored lipoprotein)
MKTLKGTALFLLLSLLPACGKQLVEFGKPGTTDAGITDARTPDARTPDAGTSDVGTVDVGTADVANIDVATPDVRIPDVGNIDAGNPDAAKIDAGENDAGRTDTTSACAQALVALGGAGNFAVLAGSTVTSAGPTSVTGDLGVSPGTAVTGFPPGTIVGAQHAGDPTAAQGVADLTTAYNDAAGRTLCAVTVAGNIGGQTLTPGLYKSTSSLEISSGNLTLDAQGDANAVFIFQMASTLTTTSGRQVTLSGGAKSTNVFWQVGTSATLGTTSAFQGTIMADQAITLNTGATLNGRALARIAAVTLDSNTIVKPVP